MSKKRGKLSTEEGNFILKNVHKLNIQEISDALNRTTKPIEKFLKNQEVQTETVSDNEYQYNLLLKRLKSRNYYKEVVKMLTEDELCRFEEEWVEVILQFKDDVLYTEEVGGKGWIILQVLADRSMKSRKDAMNDATRLQDEIVLEMQLDDNKDKIKISELNHQVGLARESMIAFTREYAQMLDRIKETEKSLKMAREARIKRIEDSKTSWQGFIRLLEDEQFRKHKGQDAEIGRMAMEKEKERLSQWHKYEDGVVDQPFLTSETMKDEFNKGEEDGEEDSEKD